MSKIKVQQIKSIIDRPNKQKLIIKALGLGKINKIKEFEDTPQIRGMIKKVEHLVRVIA
jgi:large subunit ribosomal protein L30